MKLGFQRFDGQAVADTLAPDFAVLLAGLSAHQSASVTARRQILLEKSPLAEVHEKAPQVGIFIEKASLRATTVSGSFNTEVARTLSQTSGK